MDGMPAPAMVGRPDKDTIAPPAPVLEADVVVVAEDVDVGIMVAVDKSGRLSEEAEDAAVLEAEDTEEEVEEVIVAMLACCTDGENELVRDSSRGYY